MSTTVPAVPAPVASDWDAAFAALLAQLSAAQQQLLALLARKRQMIVAGDHRGLAAAQAEEQELGAALAACQQRRQELLDQAQQEGYGAGTLTALNQGLPGAAALRRRRELEEAQRRSQLIRHECLAQWVAVQRSVLHLSQMLEIIATGGRSRPTYGDTGPHGPSGSLIDQRM
jgi:hypothetical protein